MYWDSRNDRAIRVGMLVRWKGLGITHRVVGISPSGIRVQQKGKSAISISPTTELEIKVDKGTPFIISSDVSDRKGDHMGVSKVPVAEKSKNNGGPCMCGCGELVSGYFKRGHVSGFNGKLKRIAQGEDTPTRVLGRSLAMRLGPWKDKGKGQVPSKTYRELR